MAFLTREVEGMEAELGDSWSEICRKISWGMTGAEIESESFRRIESEVPRDVRMRFDGRRWRVARRLVHTTADFSIAEALAFRGDPFDTTLEALRAGAPIYCDSNMIKSGISVPKLAKFNPSYTRDSIMCHVTDPDVAEAARANGTTRALAAVEKAVPNLDGAIVLIGNAPLALAKISLLTIEKTIRPAVVLGMPVGFVNVEESKHLLQIATDVPAVVLRGRRGGSPLAVAALHAIMEEFLDNA